MKKIEIVYRKEVIGLGIFIVLTIIFNFTLLVNISNVVTNEYDRNNGVGDGTCSYFKDFFTGKMVVLMQQQSNRCMVIYAPFIVNSIICIVINSIWLFSFFRIQDYIPIKFIDRDSLNKQPNKPGVEHE